MVRITSKQVCIRFSDFRFKQIYILDYLRASIVSTNLTISLLILLASDKCDNSPSLQQLQKNNEYNYSFDYFTLNILLEQVISLIKFN